MISLASSLLSDTPLAAAASWYQFPRQLRQKPASSMRSIFCTSLRSRKCSTRRRNAAASSSVRICSSIAHHPHCSAELECSQSRKCTIRDALKPTTTLVHKGSTAEFTSFNHLELPNRFLYRHD